MMPAMLGTGPQDPRSSLLAACSSFPSATGLSNKRSSRHPFDRIHAPQRRTCGNRGESESRRCVSKRISRESINRTPKAQQSLEMLLVHQHSQRSLLLACPRGARRGEHKPHEKRPRSTDLRFALFRFLLLVSGVRATQEEPGSGPPSVARSSIVANSSTRRGRG